MNECFEIPVVTCDRCGEALTIDDKLALCGNEFIGCSKCVELVQILEITKILKEVSR